MSRYYRKRRYYNKLYKNVTPGYGFVSINGENRGNDPTKYLTVGHGIYIATNPVYVGHIKLRFGVTQFNHSNDTTVPINPGIPWAVFYVAAGRNPGDYSFNEALGDPWSPAKDILATGVLTDKTTETTAYIRRGRKLNVGDQLVFAIGLPGANPVGTPPQWDVTSINVPLNISYKEYI